MPSRRPEAWVGLGEQATVTIATMIRAAYREVFGHVPDSVEVVGDRSMVVAVLRGVFDPEERSLVASGAFREVRRDAPRGDGADDLRGGGNYPRRAGGPDGPRGERRGSGHDHLPA